METLDKELQKLMESVHIGAAQLPDFQRGWVWDDYRIRSLIASISNNYPVGAAMFLEYGGENVRFKYKTIDGAPKTSNAPDDLILDGQQRLTSTYAALFSRNPVSTKTDKGKAIKRYYYFDIHKAVGTTTDRIDAIISVPEDRIVRSNIGRDIVLDVSSREKEFANKAFPLNIVFDFPEMAKWQNDYYAYYQYDPQIIKEYTEFNQKVLMTIFQYKMPVTTLEKSTPKEAVCQVFENVNTGGVSLTVFELVTAIFAMDDFQLREDWDKRKKATFSDGLLSVVDATAFLTACTLLAKYKRKQTISCKKKDVLELALEDYKLYADALTNGFEKAQEILNEERILLSYDLPYTTQFIPMAVLCTLLSEGRRIDTTIIKNKVKQWYWCGVLGEMYGGANETRYANDVIDVMRWVDNDSDIPRTVKEAYFAPLRLLSLQSRQSAAYKGIMALVLKNHCKDFISGKEMDFAVFKAEKIDIHHIFPKNHCEKCNYPKELWNSVINKTPISYSTNREIGGVAPSKYLEKIEKKGQVSYEALNEYLTTHLIDATCCRNDNFYDHIAIRATCLLDEIEKAMGKTISGRDSEDVINKFGTPLK